jgi:predicted ATPase
MSMTAGSEEVRLLHQALAGRYAVDCALGEGSFATVFRGRDLRHDRLVAIKLLKTQYATGEHASRFSREIRLLARLQHPNILPLLDSGEVLDMLYYVVPYVRDLSLRDRIERERRLAIDDVVRIAREVADALDYAHANGVIHRDIKPENILLSGAHAIVADFGVAFAVDPSAEDRLTRSSVGGIGTPLYMSPEQLASGRDADARSDIYSLGCVMYEMLTGAAPFAGVGGMARRFTEAAPLCSLVRPDIPLALDRIIATALATTPEERFSNAGVLAGALERLERVGAPPSESASIPIGVASSRLIGRETELVMLNTVLSANRLVTLVGPGGVGKSRLAIATAAKAQGSFHDGHVFVPLGAVSKAELVVPAIAAAMQFVFSGPREPRLQLFDALQGRHVLLVLDAFEHLMDAAPTIAAMIDAAPHVSILVTSRERLNLRQECVFEVHGLDVSTRSESGACALFIDRARRSQADFSPSETDRSAIEDICVAIDGLPLGIEIAASLIRVMSCGEIVEELKRDPGALTTPLRDVPDRHRSLRAVFDRSWELLDAGQRRVLMCLSIFHGPFDRAAATHVAGANVDILAALLDESLLQRGTNGRFALHAVVRQFAETKLNAAVDIAAAAQDARCRYYHEWLRRREEAARGARLYETVEEMAEQLEDIRHGWRRALGHGDDAIVTTYVGALYRFYLVRGRYREGMSELALADGHPLSHAVNGLQLARRSSLALHAFDIVEAQRLAQASIDALRPRLVASAEMGIALAQMGYVTAVQGKHLVANRLYSRALRLLRAHRDSESVAHTLVRQGIAQTALGQFDAAEATYAEARDIFNQAGEPRGRIMAMSNLALVLSDVGRTVEALELRQKVLLVAESTPDWFLRATAQLNLGESLAKTHQFEEARDLIARALDGLRANGRRDGIVMCHLMRGLLEREEGTDLAASEHFLLTAIGAAEEIGATSYTMEGVCELALLRAAQGRPAEAMKLAESVLHHTATTEVSRRKARALRERLEVEFPDAVEGAADGRAQSDYSGLLTSTRLPATQ